MSRAEALYICQDLLTLTNRIRINTLALSMRLPVMHASGGTKREV